MGKTRATLQLLLAYFIWSIMGVVLNKSPFTSYQNIFLFAALAIVCLFIILLAKGKVHTLFRNHYTKSFVLFMALSGIAGVMVLHSLTVLSLAEATLLLSITPIIAVFIEWAFLKHSISSYKIAAIVIGFLGVVILLFEGISSKHSLINFGVLYVLAAALVSVLRHFSAKHQRSIHTTDTVLFFTMIAQLIASAPFAFSHSWNFNLESLAITIVTGILSAVFAFYLYFHALRYIKVSTLGVISYIQVFLGAFWGIILLSQPLGLETIAGGICIIASSYLVSKKNE